MPQGSWERFLLAKRSAARRYGVALLLGIASLAIVALLQAVEEAHFSSLALTSVVLSAIYGGRGPALLDTLITAVGTDLLLSEPAFVAFDTWGSVIHIVVHALVGLLVAEIVARSRDAYRELHDQHGRTLAAKRAREEVLAIVSHDLRSPLSAILFAAECLKRGAPGEQRSIVATVERSGRQMSRLIEDLLDAERIDRGQFRIESGRHDLVEIVEETLLGVRSAAEGKHVRIEADLPRGPVPIDCDRLRIAQVVANLAGNAVKFTPQGTSVRVTLERAAAHVCIRVIDQGAGIPEADLPRLFSRHWQAPGTAHQGTGLGLFICKSIVDAHGGRIEVAAPAGGGTAFTVTLPAPQDAPA